MAIRKIAPRTIFICDGCGGEAEDTSGFWLRPPHWVEIRVNRDAYDYQGQAVADGSFTRLLCAGCALKGLTALDEALEERKA